jgi:hypothetical protein
MEPRELDGRSILAVLASDLYPSDQRAVSGVGRWDGSVLLFESSDPPVSLPMRPDLALPVAAYPVDYLCETPEEAVSVRSTLDGIEYVAFLRVPTMPEGARPIPEPMLVFFAWAPAWRREQRRTGGDI